MLICADVLRAQQAEVTYSDDFQSQANRRAGSTRRSASRSRRPKVCTRRGPIPCRARTSSTARSRLRASLAYDRSSTTTRTAAANTSRPRTTKKLDGLGRVIETRRESGAGGLDLSTCRCSTFIWRSCVYDRPQADRRADAARPVRASRCDGAGRWNASRRPVQRVGRSRRERWVVQRWRRDIGGDVAKPERVHRGRTAAALNREDRRVGTRARHGGSHGNKATRSRRVASVVLPVATTASPIPRRFA